MMISLRILWKVWDLKEEDFVGCFQDVFKVIKHVTEASSIYF